MEHHCQKLTRSMTSIKAEVVSSSGLFPALVRVLLSRPRGTSRDFSDSNVWLARVRSAVSRLTAATVHFGHPDV